MNSFNGYFWPSNSFSHQYYDMMKIHQSLFQSHQPSSQPYNQSGLKQSTSTRSVIPDYDYYPKFSDMFPNESSSSISIIESSSSGIESITDDSFETHSSSCESVIIQSVDSSSSSSSSSTRRQVIIQPQTETTTGLSKRQQRKHRKILKRQQDSPFFHEKQLLLKNKSQLHSVKRVHRRSSYEKLESQDAKLKRLYEEYSREDIPTDWKPLTFAESRLLCQYALEKYHSKRLSN